MTKLQDVFNRVQETKKEQRELKSAYREALANSKSYQDTVDKLKELRDKKNRTAGAIKEQFRKEFDRLEAIKIDLESDAEIMSDLAFNQLVKGESVRLVDNYENEYEPVFTVRFKKIK